MKFEIVFLPVISGGILGIFMGLFLQVYFKTAEIFEDKKIKTSCFLLSIKLFIELLKNMKEFLKETSLKKYLLPKVEKYLKEKNAIFIKKDIINLEIEKTVKALEGINKKTIKVYEILDDNSSNLFIKGELTEKVTQSKSLPKFENLKGVETSLWQFKSI
ncbi:hypothetical protein [uncultured Fusobacterium sp.]|uniref:hypothetical protein n=1 Tax=uncultured Fusobacterium sp. TaxID=159267 RepID=UPI0025E16556|nr:hypothetical protein [uncultured Fusobacterium sp.]